MLAAVHGLLTDECGDCLFQFRIGDLVPVVPHRVHEEPLTDREEHRQRVEEVRDVRTALVPVQYISRT